MAKALMIRYLVAAMLLAPCLLLAACNAAGDTPSSSVIEAAPAMAAPAGKPALPPPSVGSDAGHGCKTSADCAVKDAGSCCGYRPVCVNKDTPTFPEKVKAACANEGRVGICGFQAIDGCQCVSGKCEGVPMMENNAPLQ